MLSNSLAVPPSVPQSSPRGVVASPASPSPLSERLLRRLSSGALSPQMSSAVATPLSASPKAAAGFFAAGWSGDLCEVNIDECEALSCLNDGTCIDEV